MHPQRDTQVFFEESPLPFLFEERSNVASLLPSDCDLCSYDHDEGLQEPLTTVLSIPYLSPVLRTWLLVN